MIPESRLHSYSFDGVTLLNDLPVSFDGDIPTALQRYWDEGCAFARAPDEDRRAAVKIRPTLVRAVSLKPDWKDQKFHLGDDGSSFDFKFGNLCSVSYCAEEETLVDYHAPEDDFPDNHTSPNQPWMCYDSSP